MGRRQRGRKNGIWYQRFGPTPVAPCHWCDRPLTFNDATLDHEPAMAEGGDIRQGVIACYECNQARGRLTRQRIQAAKAAHLPTNP